MLQAVERGGLPGLVVRLNVAYACAEVWHDPVELLVDLVVLFLDAKSILIIAAISALGKLYGEKLLGKF